MYRVMLVDDEPWVLYGLKMMLSWEEYGFEIVAEAVNGLDALEILRNEKLDVVFSDIRMPGMDGLKLTEEVAEQNLDTKIVLISGYSEFEYARKAIKYGVFEYLLKKIKVEELKEVLIRLKQELDASRGKKKQDERLERLMDSLSAEEKISAEIFLQEETNVRGGGSDIGLYRYPIFQGSRIFYEIFSGSILTDLSYGRRPDTAVRL